MKILKSLLTLCSLFAFLFGATAWADEDQMAQLSKLVSSMQKQMSSMQHTIEQQNDKIRNLESRGPQTAPGTKVETPAAAPMSDYDFNNMLDTATGGAQKWLKNLKFSGDLRLRYEAFHYSSGNPAETDDRNRFRYRLRYGFEKTFNDEMKIGFGMASGETGGTGTNGANNDPTSTNTTFDNNFNFKSIWIEKAYATYTPKFASKRGVLDKTEITGGKLTNPFEKGSSDMIWDRDVKPEGIYEKLNFKLLDTEDVKLDAYTTFGQFVLDEDATVGGDANLYAYQVGINPVIYTPLFDRPLDWLTSFSLYDFSNYARKNNFLINGANAASATATNVRGNINSDEVTTELDASKFKVFEVYNELAVYPFNIPTRLHLDLAYNPADSARSTEMAEKGAWGAGIKFGSIVKKGDWEAGYQYKYIGAASTVGMFNDSDFGDGHAGKRGSVLKAAYAITDSITLNSAMFLVENLNPGTFGVIDLQQRRFQVDVSWKF